MLEKELNRLIEIAESFSFQNNSKSKSYGTYTQVSDDFLGWIASTESYIIDNYGEDSGPFRLLSKLDRNKLYGYEEDDFTEQKSIVLGSLKACRTIPKKEFKSKEHPIIELLKNKTFWTIIVITLGGAFAFGIHFGSAKFDKEKIDLYEENRQLRKDNILLKDSSHSIKPEVVDSIE